MAIRRHTYLLLPMILLSTVSLFAQGERPPEIFVGYSNLQAEGVPDTNNPNNFFGNSFLDRRGTLHGGNIAGTIFPFPALALTGDFSYNRQSRSVDVSGGTNTQKTNIAYFLVGPAYYFPASEHFEPFVRIMAGLGHLGYKASNKLDSAGGTFSSSFEAGSTDFAMAFGGGLDVKAGERFKVRIVQVDYAPIFIGNRSIAVLGSAGALQPMTVEGKRQDNFRFSFGVTF